MQETRSDRFKKAVVSLVGLIVDAVVAWVGLQDHHGGDIVPEKGMGERCRCNS